MEKLPPYQLDESKMYTMLPQGGRKYYTQSLFYQMQQVKDIQPLFTFNEYEHDGCYSFYQLYMACADEYEAAHTILGSWKHWKQLKQSKWFSDRLTKWDEEIEIRDRALAKATILKSAEDGNVQAAKALNDLYKRKAGRPTKDEVEGEKKKAARIDGKVANILDRMEAK